MLDSRAEDDGQFTNISAYMTFETDLPSQPLYDLCSHLEEGASGRCSCF